MRYKMPIYGCSCGDEGSNYGGWLEYTNGRGGRQQKVLDGPECKKCGVRGLLRVKWLPESFFMRNSIRQVKGTFETVNLPRFKGYFLSSSIQYNKILNHFRIIKLYGRSNAVQIDGEQEIFTGDENQRKQWLEEKGWENYVLNFIKFDSH